MPQLVSKSDSTSPFSLLPYQLSSNCSIYNLYPNLIQPLLAIELICGDLSHVEVFDLQTGKTIVPIQDTDSRFLDWTVDGKQVFLKIDTLGNPWVVYVPTDNWKAERLPYPDVLYNLAFLPDGTHALYTITQGIGFGSEVWLAKPDGKSIRRVFADPQNIVAYLRPSPDGRQIAFILFPDSQVPFPNGELWLMNVDGSNPRKLADADAGHGYAPAWSSDGNQVAFVVRENASDPQVEQSFAALVSNVYRIEVKSGAVTPVTSFTDAIVESPVWSPDGKSIAFNVIRNGKIQASVYEIGSEAVTPLGSGFSCCAVWLPGR